MQLNRAFKIFRYFFLALAILFALLLVGVNLPYSQKLITAKANRFFRGKGLPVHVEKITLLVTGKIGLKKLRIMSGKDTVAFAAGIRISVRPFPLLFKVVKLNISLDDALFHIVADDQIGQLNIVSLFSSDNKSAEIKNTAKKKWDIQVKSARLNHVRFTYDDAFHGIQLSQSIGKFYVRFSRFSLIHQQLNAAYLDLENAKGAIVMTAPLQKMAPSANGPVTWKFRLQESDFKDIFFTVDQAEEKQRMVFSLGNGAISGGEVDLADKQVSVESFRFDDPSLILFSSPELSENALTDPKAEPFSLPQTWKVWGGHLKIDHGSFHRDCYENPDRDRENYMLTELRKLNITIRNLELDPHAYGFNMSRLSFELGNGILMNKGSVFFKSDYARKSTLQINLKTKFSHVALEMEAGNDLTEIIKKSFHSVPFSIKISRSEISAYELFAFFPALKDKFPRPSQDTRLGLSGSFSGSTEFLKIGTFNLNMPAGVNLYADGYITNLMDFHSASCGISFHTGALTHDQVKKWLKIAGSATGELPNFEPLVIKGKVNKNMMAPSFTLNMLGASGSIGAEGSVDINQKKYTLETTFSNLDMGLITGIKEMDRISGGLKLKGKGFTIVKLEAAASIVLDSLSYKDHNYHQLQAALKADKGHYTFNLLSSDTALTCNLAGYFNQYDSSREGRVSGFVDIQPGKLNLYHDSIEMKGKLDASFHQTINTTIASFSLHNLVVSKGEKTNALKQASISFQSSDSLFSARAETDFLKADFQSHTALDKLMKAFTAYNLYGFSAFDSVINSNFPFISEIPDLRFSVETSYDPLIGYFVPDSVFGYHKVSFTLNKDKSGIAKGDLFVDKYNFETFHGYGNTLKLESLPGKTSLVLRTDSMKIGSFSIGTSLVDVNIARGLAGFKLKVSDRTNRILYDVAAEALRNNRNIELRPAQSQWLLNGHDWQIPPGEFLVLKPETRDFSADLHLKHNQTVIDITGRKSDTLHLDCKDVMLSMLFNPEFTRYRFDGELNGKIDYCGADGQKLRIQMEIGQMEWSDRLLGRLNIKGSYRADTLGRFESDISAIMNDTAILTVNARLGKSEHQEIIASDFTKIPVHLLEPFVSKYISGLDGNVSGKLVLTSDDKNPQLNGKIQFNNAVFKIIPLNAQFKIANDKILLENNQMLFRQFTVLDSLKKRLFVNGMIDLNKPAGITSDLEITSENLQVMNTSEKDNTTFNGTIVVNSKLYITGPVQKPSIKGTLALAGGTVINYRYSENLTISEAERTITFANLTDNHARQREISSVKQMSQSPYMEASIEIDPKSIFNFQISSGYDIGVQITGGGFLNYTLLPNKTINLSGIYEIQQGSSSLKIFGWPAKYFTISKGSFLRWDGKLEDPELNIATSSKVKGSYVNPVDNKTREVDFMVSMKLTNRLSQLEIVFDVLSDDQYIMSVISSLSTDERMRQAINLLIFERIELPNVLSSSNYLANQMNQFWESQLNQLTKSTFKKVDLSFGIDTYTGASASGGKQEFTSLTYEVKKEMFKDRGSVVISGRMNDNSQTGSQTNNMIENLSFEYALDSSRSKYLKVYHQQNYEDMLEGEVTKSGVGFIYRKNYDKLRDIWQRRERKKKANDQKNRKLNK
jgi:translocation and assembly module TamB